MAVSEGKGKITEQELAKSLTDKLQPAAIKADYESNPNTNAFTDAEKAQLAALNGDFGSHKTSIDHSFYGVTSGTNNYTVTISPAPTTYTEGLCLAIKINSENTGPSSINVNGLGSKPIKKPNGNDVSAGNLKMGSIYTIRYNGTNFILQGSDSSGNATPADLLVGKTASTDAGEIVGTMADRGAVNITPSTANQAIPVGYHNGTGVVYGDANLVASNIKNGVDIFGVVGNLTGISTLTAGELLAASNATERITYSTASYVLNRGGYICQYGGTVRVSFSLAASYAGAAYGKIYKNGVPVGIERYVENTGSGDYKTFTQDITVNKGDDIQIYCRTTPGAEAYTRDMQVKIALPFTAVTKGS